jgi:hypothetical protein
MLRSRVIPDSPLARRADFPRPNRLPRNPQPQLRRSGGSSRIRHSHEGAEGRYPSLLDREGRDRGMLPGDR